MQKKSPKRKNAVRAGFSFLELQVAFVLFGIALAGLVPLVVVQSRQLQKLESRCNDEATYYLVPSSSTWACKLGAPATIQTEDPGPPAPPAVTLIDDGDPGYSESGENWHSHFEDGAFNSELRCNHEGDGSELALWEFSGIPAGKYEVLVTWKTKDNLATNAPYTFYDGTTAEGTITVNQMLAPSGPIFEGVPWESLGVFSIVGDTLRVELNDNADVRVWADAVRIVPVRNIVQVISMEKSLISEDVTAHVSITVQLP